jgi:hypothetical protein
MAALIARLTAFVDCVLGLDQAARRRGGEVPCNMFSGFMLFGCRHDR